MFIAFSVFVTVLVALFPPTDLTAQVKRNKRRCLKANIQTEPFFEELIGVLSVGIT